MQFSSANQKNHIFYCYKGHTRCQLKNTWPWERGCNEAGYACHYHAALMRMSKDAIESKRHHPGETTRGDTPLRAFLFSLAFAPPWPVSLGSILLLLLLFPVLTGAAVGDVLMSFEVVVDISFTKNKARYNTVNLQVERRTKCGQSARFEIQRSLSDVKPRQHRVQLLGYACE